MPKFPGASAIPPQRVKRPVLHEALEQVAIGIEYIDETVACAGHVVVLLRVGDEDFHADRLNADRCPADVNTIAMPLYTAPDALESTTVKACVM